MLMIIKFLSRLTGFLCLAAALVSVIVDGSKMIAQSGLVFTTVGEFWVAVFGENMTRLAAVSPTGLEPHVMATSIDFFSILPLFAVFSVFGLLLMWIGWPRQMRGLSYV